jgi:hypothetical protein
VFEREKKQFVRIREGRSAEFRSVSLGLRGSNWVEVTEGLEGGESILLNTPEKETR